MPQFEKHHPVHHNADDMFALVADIEHYPEYVPLCQSLTIRSSQKRGERTVLVANMAVGYMAIRETFTCQVILDPAANKINVTYIDGPFEYLENQWHFEPVDAGNCIVHFKLDYEFKSRTLAMLMGSMFDRAFARFTDAFEQRADKLHGSERLAPAKG